MNVIIIIIAVIAVASSFTIWAGLIMLFFKSRRKKGARIAVVSLFNIVVLGGTGAVLQAKYGTDTYTDFAETQTATPAAHSTRTASGTVNAATAPQQPTNEPAWKAAGFPTAQAADKAKALGVKSYAAYRLYNDGDAIAQYCAWSYKNFALSRQRDIDLEANPGEEARNEIFGKYDALQRELQANLASLLGIKEWELNALAMNAQWAAHCRAKNQGWGVITPNLAASASRSDAKEAREALYYFYLGNLSAGASSFFDNDRYSSVNCKWENVGDKRVVGCKLQSFSAISDWDLFTVARLQDGRLAVAPMNGITSSHITNLEDLNYVQVTGFPRAYLAEFAGDVDFSALREQFN
ncbi:hypothetical protein K4L02_00855 [Phaeobacter inhibens]|uniref:hypothetical protein n=1 Tax=Phaeobacter inhibens TaxID=221822 RepID=UPI0021A5D835|nr:hypothetical protein [Phaeobacter inhibens]UWR64821.1 hypothetical protein K4L02_00855 [Phaeobacter inhibens]